MKSVILGLLLSLAVALVMLLPRKSVHAELVIDAPPSVVWDAIMDTRSYGEWNPIFVAVEGTFFKGVDVEVDMLLPDGRTTWLTAKVVDIVPEQKLHQRAGTPGFLTADHQWLLEETPEGTRVAQHEEYRGAGVLFYDPAYAEALYAEGLAALKARLEGDAR